MYLNTFYLKKNTNSPHADFEAFFVKKKKKKPRDVGVKLISNINIIIRAEKIVKHPYPSSIVNI